MIRLAPREKLLVLSLAVFVAVWLLYVLAVNPALDRIETLDRIISEKQQELEEIRAISKEYIFLNKNLSNLRTRDDSERDTLELLPFLESLINECGIAKNVETMKRQVLPMDSNYSEIIVEVRLESLSIGQLVDFLGKIESSQAGTKTKSLYVKRNVTNENLLDSVVEIHNTEFSRNEHARI